MGKLPDLHFGFRKENEEVENRNYIDWLADYPVYLTLSYWILVSSILDSGNDSGNANYVYSYI